MKTFNYNDIEFVVAQAEGKKGRWDISRKNPDGGEALVGAGLFEGLPENEAEVRARSLVKTVLPVGIKIVGPDVTHSNLIGDMKIVGPDVTHPNFIYWDKDSSSFPK